MKDLFWRLILVVFGPAYEWLQRRQIKYYMWRRRRDCRRGHIALARAVVPVDERLGAAVVRRVLVCQHCGAVTHRTWKGRMTRKDRELLARFPFPVIDSVVDVDERRGMR